VAERHQRPSARTGSQSSAIFDPCVGRRPVGTRHVRLRSVHQSRARAAYSAGRCATTFALRPQDRAGFHLTSQGSRLAGSTTARTSRGDPDPSHASSNAQDSADAPEGRDAVVRTRAAPLVLRSSSASAARCSSLEPGASAREHPLPALPPPLVDFFRCEPLHRSPSRRDVFPIGPSSDQPVQLRLLCADRWDAIAPSSVGIGSTCLSCRRSAEGVRPSPPRCDGRVARENFEQDDAEQLVVAD